MILYQLSILYYFLLDNVLTITDLARVSSERVEK